MKSPATAPSRSRATRRVVLALGLGLLTTIGVAWGAAACASLVRHRAPDEVGAIVIGKGTDTSGFSIRGGFYVYRGIAGERVWFGAWSVGPFTGAGGEPDMPPGDIVSITRTKEADAQLPEDGMERAEWVDLPPCWALTAYERMYERTRSWVARGEPAHLPTIAFAERYGWPWCVAEFDGLSGSTWRVFDGLVVRMDTSEAHPGRSVILPLRVHWGAALADWLAHTILWLVALFGVAATVRASRRRRGRCPGCGYNLGGLTRTVCSECGAARTHARGSARPVSETPRAPPG